ncbi:MAG: SRPBCC family protein, partial [Chitinophagaceae bacterium]|nr:SRPBCC family protein [Chitinophagaceae bacterium]
AKININAPVNKVFEVTADGRQQLIWDKGSFSALEELTPPPTQKGSKFKCRVKGMGKMMYEFAEYQPPGIFVHKSVTGMCYGTHYFQFTETAEGTLFSQTMELRMRGFFILLSPFVSFGLQRSLNRMNKELKAYIESKIQT